MRCGLPANTIGDSSCCSRAALRRHTENELMRIGFKFLLTTPLRLPARSPRAFEADAYGAKS
jgi:hypothetical protein